MSKKCSVKGKLEGKYTLYTDWQFFVDTQNVLIMYGIDVRIAKILIEENASVIVDIFIIMI